MSVVATLIIEIPGSFLLISPFRNVRLVGVILQLTLQLLICLTGNYNFFNLLTAVLCVTCMDDEMLPSWRGCGGSSEKTVEEEVQEEKIVMEEEEGWMQRTDVLGVVNTVPVLISGAERRCPTTVILLTCVAPLVWSTWQLVGVREVSSSSSSSSFSLDSHRLYLKTDANLINSLIDEWIVIVVLVPSFLIVFLAFHHFMISLQCLFIEIGNGVLNGCTTKGRGGGRGKGKGEEVREEEAEEEEELSSRRRRPGCWCDCGLTLLTACFRLLRSTFSLFLVILFLSSTSVTFISISKSFQTKIPSFGKFCLFFFGNKKINFVFLIFVLYIFVVVELLLRSTRR